MDEIISKTVEATVFSVIPKVHVKKIPFQPLTLKQASFDSSFISQV